MSPIFLRSLNPSLNQVFCSFLASASPPTSCSFAHHSVGKMAMFRSFAHHLAPAKRVISRRDLLIPWSKGHLTLFQRFFFIIPERAPCRIARGAVFTFTPVFGWSVRRFPLPFSRWHLSSSRYSTRPSLLETKRGTLAFNKAHI